MLRRLCKMLDVHPSGFYAWRAVPESARGQEDRRLLGHIKQYWLESDAVYGYRKIHHDLRELGETCGRNRVYRLIKRESLRAQVGTQDCGECTPRGATADTTRSCRHPTNCARRSA